jgi:murein DD-endopeptidase MepM/ murein hydrolase activator NlpD
MLRAGPLGAAVLALLAAASGAEETVPCGEGLSLRLSSLRPRQGDIVTLTVSSHQLLTSVTATLSGRPVAFWQEDSAPARHRALLGVDLRAAPRDAVIEVDALARSGERFGCRARLLVQEGGFAVQHLTVDPRYVELDPRDLARSQRETRKLQRIFRESTSGRLWRGPFHTPLPGHSPSGSFGKRRVLNGQPRSPHSGEDYSAAAGEPVRAPQAGRIALAEDLFFTGKTVVIDHGLGLYTLYAHLDSVAVEGEEVVERGTLLGRVGSTGRVTGAHLHWAARLGEARVNPLQLLDWEEPAAAER